MQGFFDSLRIELMGTGVDVLIVSPGPVATSIHTRRLGGDSTLSEGSREPDERSRNAGRRLARGQIVAAIEPPAA